MSQDIFDMLMGFVDEPEEKRDKDVLRAPFGWPGGKDQSKNTILKELPYRKSFIEHCGGTGIVILNRVQSKLDVFNDRDSGVTCFYRCLRNQEKMARLVQMLEYSVHSREEFVACKKSWGHCADDVERAFKWYYVTRHSFSQQRRNWGRAIAGTAQQPGMIHSSLLEFPKIHARLKQIQIENLDIFQSLKDYDNADAVHYIDPDYLGSSPGIYKHGIGGESGHQKLLEQVQNGKGYFAISGYAHPIYDANDLKWDKRLVWNVSVTAQAQAFTESNNKLGQKDNLQRTTAEEVLWIKDNAI